MKFSITSPHSGSGAPPEAIDLLWVHLDGRGFEKVSFTYTGSIIRASATDDAPSSIERSERERIGRRVVLDCVRNVCDSAPELKFDWFAVSPAR
jgi:hypothetical protein